MARVAVIGAGSWGTTVADICARRVPTTLWARREGLARQIDSQHENRDYLPGVQLRDSLRSTSCLEEAVSGASIVVMAVPSHGFREVLSAAGEHMDAGTPVLSLTKGFEQKTNLRMTEVVEAVLPGRTCGVLTGPNLAREIAVGQPAATVVAMTDAEVARELQELLRTESLRVYTNPDVTGCELAGATKNVIAIAAGILDGIGLGDSSRAALITRGLAELGRLALAKGSELVTVGGLAGIGDLVATCTSGLSRNRNLGVELGRGRPLQEIVAGTRMVAEGVKSARPLLDMAAGCGVEMPIGEQVASVLEGGSSPQEAMTSLMQRSSKEEFGPVRTRRPSGTTPEGAGR
jgi:glycerol-3-phosphate dehydrogenase (NAD(P)+)